MEKSKIEQHFQNMKKYLSHIKRRKEEFELLKKKHSKLKDCDFKKFLYVTDTGGETE